QGHDLGLHCGASSKAREKGIEQHQYKVEHSGGRLPVFGGKSNISNAYDADVVFRKDRFRQVRVCSRLFTMLIGPSWNTARKPLRLRITWKFVKQRSLTLRPRLPPRARRVGGPRSPLWLEQETCGDRGDRILRCVGIIGCRKRDHRCSRAML